ncbi:response regulator [Rhizobium oryzicola]|uniref:histidine kinase n=1 Tax=Rhizobium oryzicola TaxID=1232668 RepID=A0ABT8SUX1_9HYPH|nr:response regulator [Rhizobium oryzicola]MDO1582225.1 response regulator [Rhizobium oryzicola]
MSSNSELLQRACDRILELDRPAFIKDGALRYVVVNEPFARLHGCSRDAFTGRTAQDFPAGPEDDEADLRQRRSLIFGSDEIVQGLKVKDFGRVDLHVERFLTDDDQVFLFGFLMVENDAYLGSQPALVPASVPAAALQAEAGATDAFFTPAMMGTALDLLDAGVGIYDDHDILRHFNRHFQEYFATSGVKLHPGMSLRAVMEQLYDGEARPDLDEDGGGNARADWVNERLRVYAQEQSHSMVSLPDGRWLRSVNKRLDNGWLVMLRLDVTEFKIQELRLGKQIEEAEIFRAALENLPVAVFLRDSQRRLLYANAQYEHILGGDRQAFIGKSDEDMFPAAAERFRRENENLLANGGVLEKTSEIDMPDGNSISALTKLVRVCSPAGERYVVGSISDVTQVRAAQKEAERLNRELEAVLDSMPVGVAILDDELRFQYVNRKLYELWFTDFGLEEKLVGRRYDDFLRQNFEHGVYGGGYDNFDTFCRERLSLLRDAGEMIPIEFKTGAGHTLVISRSHLSDGKILLNYMDITAIRKREEEIQAALKAVEHHGALLADATGAMTQGLLILRDRHIVFANAAVPSIIDLPVEFCALGRYWGDAFDHIAARGDFGSAEQAAALRAEWDNFQAIGQSYTHTIHISGRKWVAIEVTLSERGNLLAVFTDVTEARQREAQLKNLLHRAEAADRAKSEFLANMSHEIRTPMNGVLGMAELLAKTQLDARQRTFTDIIGKSGNALLTIINDILDFSKIDAGQMTLRKAPFDPVEAIEDVATLLSSSAREKDIELLVRCARVKHTVVGDAGRFRQIVTNLVGNAIKFTERGHIIIDIDTRSMSDDQMELELRIEDTGIGIPVDKLHTIFEKFSQVDTSSTRRHEGTGLGLAITAGLVALFGGKIAVESQVGIGSVFSITMPFPVAAKRDISTTTSVSVRGARVLVIDDNPVNRRILSEQLTMWEFDAVAADSGQEGLAVLCAAAEMGIKVDAVVLDYHMPGMNGMDVARQIRTDERLRDCGIIFLTSMDTVGNEPDYELLNIQAHLMKPARSNVLRSAIHEVVRSVRFRNHPKLQDVAANIERFADTPSVPALSVPTRHAGLEVLVAEDNDVNQIVFTQILQSSGRSFKIVNNGAEAIQAWERERPAIILMDVSMPVLNGHQATRRIREIEERVGGHVPIIGVTAHALDVDRDLCLAAGMDDYLSKPISPELLEAKIDQWYGKMDAAAQSGS